MASATVTSKGQITIPVEIRHRMGLRSGDRVQFAETDKGKFVMTAANRSIRELEGLLWRKGRKPVTIEEMNKSIARGAAGLE
jgi:AbrB family looped-hinge helix DNA binding protein